ncbi:MAG: stage III sporulation protein AF [Oscillospiraceae bacterium]|nr:stage III sporulation protein AF [Oscillospiraceae bacterium]
MELFRGWLLGIVATALILAVIYTLVPSGKFRTTARFTGGLVLLLAVLGPLGRLNPGWDMTFSDYADQIQRQIDGYRTENLDKTRNIIAGQIAAYISDKGKEMGIDCHPTVTTRLEDGVPLPDTVTMDIPLNESLAACITADLGIPRERQIWQER